MKPRFPFRPMLLPTTALLLVVATVASAQTVPTTLHYQGRLTDNTPQQSPIDGTVSMRFAIWDAVSGGSQLWQEPATGGLALPVTDGRFDVRLGSAVALPASVFTGASASRWLEVTIDPDTGNQQTLTPRQALAAVAYAQLADRAENAASAQSAADTSALGGTASSFWQRALGTPACSGGQFFKEIRTSGIASCGTPSITETDPEVGSVSGDRIPKWNGSVLQDGSITSDGAGAVGIGATAPTQALDVDGSIRIRDGFPADGKELGATNTAGQTVWRPAAAEMFTAATPSTEGGILGTGSAAWIDLNDAGGYAQDVQGPGTFVVLASWSYEIQGGSGTDQLSWRFRAVSSSCAPVVSDSESGLIEDQQRDDWHPVTFHSTITLGACQYAVNLQYWDGASDDSLRWDDLEVTTLRMSH